MSVTLDEKEFLFFQTGLQYYISGRFSAFAWFIPVSGNLFHHAIEMFLKGHLSSKMTLEDLKNKFSHKLGSLWHCFKQDVADPGLDRFDQTISDLDQFESIRYPDRILSLGMRSFINIKHRHTDDPQFPAGPQPKYQIVVKEIDELVKVIFEKTSLSPPFFTNSLNTEAKSILEKNNETPLG